MHRSICVFCGSSPGANPAYSEAARELGAVLAAEGRRLVYGGGNVGLMGVVADAVLQAGGTVVGVIPQHLLDLEVGHRGVTELRVVHSMHERKEQMSTLADAFVLLPGGLGSLEEFFEIWTWGQLGMHDKPCGLLNVAGYFDGLLEFLDRAVDEKFVRDVHRGMVVVESDPADLLARFEAYEPPRVVKWINAGTI